MSWYPSCLKTILWCEYQLMHVDKSRFKIMVENISQCLQHILKSYFQINLAVVIIGFLLLWVRIDKWNLLLTAFHACLCVQRHPA